MRTRVLSRRYHGLARYLDMDCEMKSLALYLAMGLDGEQKMLDLEKFKVNGELNSWVDYERLSTHEEFLDKMPRFCKYLFREANKNQ